MKKKLLSVMLAATLILSFGLMAVPVTAAANKTVAPPNIDGSIASGEWEIAQIEFDTGPRPYGDDNLGSWDLSGAKGRFLWDETNLYGLVEAYPNTGGAGANPNGPFDAINFEVYVNGVGDPASYFLTAWPDGTTEASPGAVVMGSPDAMLIEFEIPFANIICREPEERSFNPTTDWLEYRLSTTDPDTAGGFCSAKQTDGEWLRLDFANTTVEAVTVVPEDLIQISVSPLTLDFGEVYRGQSSASLPMEITNTGSVPVNVSTSTGSAFYQAALTIDGISVVTWNDEITSPGSIFPKAQVTVPSNWASGVQTGAIIFWAEAK